MPSKQTEERTRLLPGYNTFSDENSSISRLLSTSDRIEHTKKTILESENIAREVLVDMEMQREQLKDVGGNVRETTGFTAKTRQLLERIASRSHRKKACLRLIIVILVLVDILTFYFLFIKRNN